MAKGMIEFSDLSKIIDNTEMKLTPFSTISLGSEGKQEESEATLKAKIKDAVDNQTLHQYKSYAAEQFPKDASKQKELIIQLQDQHFKTYWTQVHLEMCRYQRIQIDLLKRNLPCESLDEFSKKLIDGQLEICPAKLWTQKNISEFKSNILSKCRTNCIKIQSLSSAIIKVPTILDGQSIGWEFTTDYYDIGFGLLFEWNTSPSSKIEITLSDSSDDEDDNNNNDKEEQRRMKERMDNSSMSVQTIFNSTDNSMAVSNHHLQPTPETGNSTESKLIQHELISTFRRDSHECVICGSHKYPGKGYYVLKFDNTYSVWRSKWLYYKVYTMN